MTLHSCRLDKPIHNLTVEKLPSSVKDCARTSIQKDSEDLDGESDSDNDESFSVEDDEDIFTAEDVRRRITDMIPDNSVDNAEIMIQFRQQFEDRYGHQHPEFFLGSLPSAIEEANGPSAQQRKPLLIYLHHDGSILTNVFCCQLLCAESIVTFINQNFLCWAWDMTHDANKARFLNMANHHFGSVAANTVRGFGAEQFPLVLVVMKNKSAMEVATVLQGHITVDELMTGLISAHDVFQQAIELEIREEAERDAREQVKREQDEAYEESLKADRAKAEEKRRMEEEAMMAKKQAEEQALHDAELKEAQRLSLEDQLPQEPGPECTEPVTILRFRLPGGERLTRRFLARNILKCVLIYVQSSGYLENEYKVVTNFPRRELYNMDPNQTLQDAGLYPQETIFVEEC